MEVNQSNSLTIELSAMSLWKTVKETTGLLKSRGRNRLFIGLFSWPGKKKKKKNRKNVEETLGGI